MHEQWCFSGHKVAKDQIVYFTQIFVVLVVVLFSIVNLTLGLPNKDIWIILLSSTLGYILPSPSMKNERLLHQSTQQHDQNQRAQQYVV